eukprot:scaffold2341_cov212-Skeletonema_menzelii.AAC.7
MQYEYNTGQPWDFSHADTSIITFLEKYPGYDIYIYRYATSYLPTSGHQAPMYAGFLMPDKLGPPTNSMCLVDNQKSTEELHSFDKFGFFWKQSGDPNHQGRVHLLACDKDLESMSENDSYSHEYSVIFIVCPNDLSTNRGGKLNVDGVKFVFPMLDGEKADFTWFPEENNVDECINVILEHYFDKEELEEFGFKSEEERRIKTAKITGDLRPVSFSSPQSSTTSLHMHNFLLTITTILVPQIMLAALERTREQKQEMNDSFLSSVNYTAEDLDKIELVNIFPINLPAPIKPKMPGKYMDQFWQQLGDNKRHVISDHYSTDQTGLLPQLRQLAGDRVLSVFGIADTSSSTQLLHEILVVDFLFATSGFGSSSNPGYNITQFLQLLGSILSNFGITRIIQFMGDGSSEIGNKVAMDKARYNAYIKKVIDGARDAIVTIGHPPSSTMDFLNFLFDKQPDRQRGDLFGAESIRLKANSKTLQVQVGGRWIDVDVHELGKIISEDGRIELLLHLLLHPSGHKLAIPSGARDGEDSVDDAAAQCRSFNCVKASLMLTTDEVLSPSGKSRVDEALPNHEIPMPQFLSKLDTSVKTIKVKEIKSNRYETAMTGVDEMLGMFQDGGGNKHCVYINGSEGTISDPVEGFGVGLPRTKESLRQLGISEFRQVFTVRRHNNELSEKKRKFLQKKTGLPYF